MAATRSRKARRPGALRRRLTRRGRARARRLSAPAPLDGVAFAPPPPPAKAPRREEIDIARWEGEGGGVS